MDILVVANLYEPYVIGGGEISTKILVENLIRLGHNVTVLTSYSNDKEEYIDNVRIIRIRNNIYWSYEKDNKSNAKKAFWHIVDDYNILIRNRVSQVLIEKPLDLVMSSTLDGFSGILWKLARKRGIPTVHFLRSYSLVCLNAGMFRHGKNCVGQCTTCKIFNFNKRRHSNKYVNGVIGISNHILEKHHALGLFKNSKSSVLHNSISLNKEKPSKNLTDRIKLGYVGSIQQKKGVEVLLKAFSSISNDAIELHMYGKPVEGAYLAYLKNNFTQNNVYYHGYADQHEIFSSIDILVVPSLWEEPFGRIIIEAYKYGVPVLGANKGGIPELIKNGKTGIVYEAFDHTELVDSLERLKKDYIKISQQCYDFAKNFSSKEIFAKLDQFIHKIVDA